MKNNRVCLLMDSVAQHCHSRAILGCMKPRGAPTSLKSSQISQRLSSRKTCLRTGIARGTIQLIDGGELALPHQCSCHEENSYLKCLCKKNTVAGKPHRGCKHMSQGCKRGALLSKQLPTTHMGKPRPNFSLQVQIVNIHSCQQTTTYQSKPSCKQENHAKHMIISSKFQHQQQATT